MVCLLKILHLHARKRLCLTVVIAEMGHCAQEDGAAVIVENADTKY